MKNLAKLGFLASLALVACKNEETETDDHDHDHEHHVTYVINEGAFQGNNGSISSVDDEGNVEQNLYFTANGEELGDVVQDMVITNEHGFIVVNNSQKVEVVDLADFTSEAQLTFSYPRHAIVADGRVFVSNGSSFGQGKVFEIDPASSMIIDSVNVGTGPERMEVNGSDLLVANFAWGGDSTVSVVNLSSLTETQKVTVGAGPSTIVKDANGDVWVLSQGKTTYNSDWSAIIAQEGSKLVQLSGTDYSLLKTIELGDSTKSVSKLAISADGQNLYYSDGGIHKLSISATTASSSAFIADQTVTGLAVNEEGQIVVLSGDYASNGTIKIYNTSGNLVSSHDTGIAPNGIAFE